MKLTILTILLALSLLLASCQKGDGNSGPAEGGQAGEAYDAGTDEQSQSVDFEMLRQEIMGANADFAGGLTLEQKLEDYEYFWQTLREGYPFWGVAERMGIDSDAVYTMGKEYLETNSSDLDFNSIMYQITAMSFGNLGHLEAFSSATYYQYLLDVYTPIRDQNPRWEHALQVVDNPTSKQYYDGMKKLEDEIDALQEDEAADQAGANSSERVESNATTEILEEGRIAYVRIPSFDSLMVDSDHQMLLDFYGQVADYPHLIVDLTGNGGGDDRYWNDNIVTPNIDTPLTANQYFLFDAQAACNQTYLGLTFPEEFQPISQLPQLPNLADGDLANMDSFVNLQKEVEPSGDGKLFRGRIWVLVDEWVCSSSESFALFCKDTGFATLVGVTTHGDGGGPDANYFVMPNSGLVFRFHVLHGLNTDGSSNVERGTTPDIVSPQGESPLDTCLREIAAL